MQNIRLGTQRLTIRQFSQQDAQGYFRLLNNPQVHCFVSEKLESIEQARDKIQEISKIQDGSELAVCLKETGEFIGTLFGLWEGDTFSVCWNFLSDYQGKGYAYEAAKAYLNFLFGQMNARRIYAYVEDYNLSSQHFCEKLGMRREGVFKEYISFVTRPDGTPVYENTMQYAILKKEWNGSNPLD